MSPLKYFATEVVWPQGVFFAANTVLNDHKIITDVLQ